jgi:site-specific DNA recombinase
VIFQKLPPVEASPVLMHPNLAEAYQRKLGQLTSMLNDPAFASEAIPLIRELIDRVDLRHTPEGWEVVLHGQLAALFNVALSDKKQAHPVTDEPCFIGSTKVVAGTGLSVGRIQLEYIK